MQIQTIKQEKTNLTSHKYIIPWEANETTKERDSRKRISKNGMQFPSKEETKER